MALNLPLPTMDDTSILGQVGKLNALQKSSAEGRYAGANERANALSKTAYAQYRPAEIAAQMMLSPAFRQLDSGTQNSLIQRYAGYLNNPMQMSDIFPQNDNVFSILMNYLTAGRSQPTSNPMARQQSGGAAPVQLGGAPSGAGNGSNNYAYDANGNNIKLNDNEVNNIAQNGNGTIGAGTPAAGQAASQTTPGSTGGFGPVDAANAQAEAGKTAVVGQQQNQNAQKLETDKQLNNQSRIGTQALKALNGWYRNYKKSTYRGQRAGSYPASGPGSIPTGPGANSSPEQLADNYSNQYLSLLSGLGDTPAGQTDAGREILSGSKVNRALDDDAADEAFESQKAKIERMIKQQTFSNSFYKNNPDGTNEQLIGLMNEYDKYAPSYDYENGKSLPENDSKYTDFTSKKALKSFIDNNGEYNPYKGKKSSNQKGSGTKEQPIGVIHKMKKFNGKNHVQDKSGGWWEII